jgi:hypothetical protein
MSNSTTNDTEKLKQKLEAAYGELEYYHKWEEAVLAYQSIKKRIALEEAKLKELVASHESQEKSLNQTKNKLQKRLSLLESEIEEKASEMVDIQVSLFRDEIAALNKLAQRDFRSTNDQIRWLIMQENMRYNKK